MAKHTAPAPPLDAEYAAQSLNVPITCTDCALAPVAKPLLYAALGYRKARRMADAVAPLGGREALDYASDLLSLEIVARGVERIPREGRFIAIVNHPTRLADGVPVYEVIKPIRPDLLFFANSDAQRVNPRFDDVFIPVEWVEEKRTRERTRLTLERAQAALSQERPLIIYPAGRVSRRTAEGFPTDPPWQTSAAALARRHRAPITQALRHFFHHFFQRIAIATLQEDSFRLRHHPADQRPAANF